jgi:hypothetical protein
MITAQKMQFVLGKIIEYLPKARKFTGLETKFTFEQNSNLGSIISIFK